MSLRQYEFRDGHFVDTWNEGYDDTCNPAEHGQESWPEMLLEGVCGCGNPEEVAAAMADYLGRVEVKMVAGGPRQVREGADWLADVLLAYMADDIGLTMHGGSINWCWLEPAGVRWLELWRDRPASPNGETPGA